MMKRPCFVGDELSAAGFRLAGFRTETPMPGQEAVSLREAREVADLVVITAELAAHVPESELRRWQTALRPLLLVVADMRGRMNAPDLGAGLRRQLGLVE